MTAPGRTRHRPGSRCLRALGGSRRPVGVLRRAVRPRIPDGRAGRADRGLPAGPPRSGLPRRTRRPAGRLRRPPDPADPGRPVRRAGRRLHRAAQARGSRPHRVAQDQQRARPGAAGQAHGQDAGHRRDRRGPARRGHRHRGRPARPGLRRLHGRGGHPPAGPERLPHAHAGRGGDPGHRGHPHAQGRHERGLPRLGGHGRPHPLLHRLGRRAPSVPDDGQGLPADHRRGGQGAGARGRKGGCPTR